MITYQYNENDNELENKNETNNTYVKASVKWYNPIKGYGFLNREGNSEDIMIHFAALDKVGCAYVKTGDRVICEVVPGKSGTYVARVIEVKFGSPEPRSLSGFLGSQSTPFDPESLEEVEGIIKWYNPDKGYGFILPNDGTKEIFIHYSVVHNTGLKTLEPGIRVLAKVSTSERGQEARIITVCKKEEKKKIAI